MKRYPVTTATVRILLACALDILGLSTLPAHAQCLPTVAQTLGSDPHHTAIAGGRGNDGTQLAAHDTIVIQAYATSDPPAPTPAPCRSITNNSAVSYFVPWETPKEWQAFLNAVTSGHLPGVSIGQCCPADTTETICGNTIGSMNGTGNNNLGARWLGRPAGGMTNPITANDIPYYGGANDVVGPIYACNALGAYVDFAATYVCENGSWVQTHSVGSCTPLDGVCGAIPSGGFVTLPSDLTTLCASGSILQNLTGTGPWSWQCYGTLGIANCSATVYAPVNGICGTASGGNFTSIPTNNLCTAGTASAVTPYYGGWIWAWNCNGIDGGSTASFCYALNTLTPGACGPASGETLFTAPSLPADLCASGDTASAVTESGSGTYSEWSWTCAGPGGGPAASCYAVNGNEAGICGGDSGQTLSSAPTNLCSSGTPGPVTDASGMYWYWYCYQADNPTGTYCQALNAGAPACGSANGATLSSAPSGASLCFSGVPTNYTVTASQWSWTCNTSWPSQVSCSATNLFAPVNGACGGATGVPVLTAPSTGLCSVGTPSAVTGDGPWSWSCLGANGGSAAQCTAPLMASYDGACGTANGTAIPNTPNINLCATGTPSAVSGTGPWTWSCLGAGTGTDASCSAYLCNACTGNVNMSLGSARTVTDGSCQAQGTAGWTETYSLVTSNNGLGPLSIQWSDVFGSYSGTINQDAAPWPQYCSPCYLQHSSASNVGTQINSDNGSCPPGENAGSFVPGTGTTIQ